MAEDIFKYVTSSKDKNKCEARLKDGVTGLTSVTVPSEYKGKAVTSVVVSGCSKTLKSIILPKSLEVIKPRNFEGYVALEEVVIPDAVNDIGGSAFEGCTSLRRVILPKSLKRIGKESFKDCSSLEEIFIPDSTEAIRYCAFQNCKSLKKVQLSHGLRVIEEGAFTHAESLEELIIPEGVKVIEGYAFDSCFSLKNVTLPSTVTDVDNISFLNCKSLKNVLVSPNTKVHYRESYFSYTPNFMKCSSREDKINYYIKSCALDRDSVSFYTDETSGVEYMFAKNNDEKPLYFLFSLNLTSRCEEVGIEVFFGFAESIYQDANKFKALKNLFLSVINKKYGLYEDDLLFILIEDENFRNTFKYIAYRLCCADEGLYDRLGFYQFRIDLYTYKDLEEFERE